MFIKLSKNKYGTEISIHKCDTCGKEFSVCPATPDGYPDCLSTECDSFNPDCDLLNQLPDC